MSLEIIPNPKLNDEWYISTWDDGECVPVEDKSFYDYMDSLVTNMDSSKSFSPQDGKEK